MLTYKQDGNVYFLTEYRLCAVCCRMFNRNATPHLMATCEGVLLFKHLYCPTDKPTPATIERGMR